jgi:hypothetical protein
MRNLRRKCGSTIAETGPSLMILFIFIFFPMLDLLAMVVQYSAGWYLNSISAHEVACLRQVDPTTGADNWQPALNAESSFFCSTGLGKFLQVSTNNISQTATIIAGANPPAVEVVTTLPISPMLHVPFFGHSVPGLNAPFNVTYVCDREREDTR